MNLQPQNLDPFLFTSGPRNAEVIIIGEAWGADEALQRLPFVGASGKELTRILAEAGLPRERALLCNVVDAKPENNDFEYFWNTPALTAGLNKLDQLISIVKPKLIIGCGNIPLWAMTSRASSKKPPGGITDWRGSQLYTIPINGVEYPFLPIFHPAAILRSWDLRSITVHDIKVRALRYLHNIRPWKEPAREMYFSADISSQLSVLDYWLSSSTELLLSVDIETYRRKFIVCIGLADTQRAICFPFFYFKSDGTIVDVMSAEMEATVWIKLKTLLEQPRVKVTGQNFIYDIQYLRRCIGINIIPAFDTMLAHHLCWPGTPKGLSYLASLYCDHYIYWKDESQEWDTGLTHEQMWKYNCKDVIYTIEITRELQNLIPKLNLSQQFIWQMEQWELAADMMRRGIRIDVKLMEKIRTDLMEIGCKLETYLLACVPEDLKLTSTGGYWFNSPKATAELFYHYIGLPVQLHRKTKKPTTDDTALDAIQKKIPWIRPLITCLSDLRSTGVFVSHFIDVKLFFGRMCSSFNVGGTETFRWSSSSNGFDEGTNLQNIPKGDEE